MDYMHMQIGLIRMRRFQIPRLVAVRAEDSALDPQRTQSSVLSVGFQIQARSICLASHSWRPWPSEFWKVITVSIRVLAS